MPFLSLTDRQFDGSEIFSSLLDEPEVGEVNVFYARGGKNGGESVGDERK